MQLLFLLTSIGLCYKKQDFNQVYFWKETPEVVICHNALVSVKNVREAINFWQSKSFDISKKIVKKKCDKSHKKGEVRITHQQDLDITKYYAYTSRDTNGKTVSAANIKIDNEYHDNLELIIHELGHALGINHTNKDSTHIMNMHVVENNTRLD